MWVPVSIHVPLLLLCSPGREHPHCHVGVDTEKHPICFLSRLQQVSLFISTHMECLSGAPKGSCLRQLIWWQPNCRSPAAMSLLLHCQPIVPSPTQHTSSNQPAAGDTSCRLRGCSSTHTRCALLLRALCAAARIVCDPGCFGPNTERNCLRLLRCTVCLLVLLRAFAVDRVCLLWCSTPNAKDAMTAAAT
jgi:hypothetical protein